MDMVFILLIVINLSLTGFVTNQIHESPTKKHYEPLHVLYCENYDGRTSSGMIYNYSQIRLRFCHQKLYREMVEIKI